MFIKIVGEIGWNVLTEDVTAKLDEATGDVTLWCCYTSSY